MTRRVLAGAALLALLTTACGTDMTNPRTAPTDKPIMLATGAGCSTLSVGELTANLNTLMAVLTPNNNSAQSKWQNILDNLAAGNVQAAWDDYGVLKKFVELKNSQAPGAMITATDPDSTATDYMNTLLGQMECYVYLHSFDINPGDPPKTFVSPDGTGGVWFPQDFVPQGYNVVIELGPQGNGLRTKLDTYGYEFFLKLVDGNGNELTDYSTLKWANGKPVVAICWPAGLPTEVRDRLYVGHQKASDQTESGFELLDRVGIPQDLVNALDGCGDYFPTTSTSALGRFLRKAADLLLPESVQAQFFGFYGGGGGSPEEFSPFGATDGGLAFGGGGGSPEEFAPAALPSAAAGPMTSTVSNGGTYVTGTADEADVTDPTELPYVQVVTPFFKKGVNGVKVTFAMSTPITGIYKDSVSTATLCSPTETYTADYTYKKANGADTTVSGVAHVPCINFGTDPGFMNLKATFDPSGVDPLACIIDANGDCSADEDQNFLVETVPGAAANLNVTSTNPFTGQLGEKLADITLKVTDGSASLNPIAGQKVSITPTLGGGGTLACYTSGSTACFNDQTTKPDGTVTFSDLMITGQVAGKQQTISFTATTASTTLNASAKVTLSPGVAYSWTVTPATTTATALYPDGGAPADAIKATVKDQWGNKVPDSTVTVLAPSGYTLKGTKSVKTAEVGTTTKDTLAVFDALTLGGTAGSVQLTFKSAGLTDKTVTVSLAPGTASEWTVTPTTTTATALYPDGGALMDAIKATVKDGWGNKVPDSTVTVSPPSGYTLKGTKSVKTAEVGTTTKDTLAVFDALTLGGTAGSVPLTFKSAGLSDKTVTVTLAAGPATQLAVSPTSVTANLGSTIPTLTATLKDGWLNLASPSTGGVTASVPPGYTLNGTLNGTSSKSVTAGVASFNDLKVDGPTDNVTLTFNANGTNTATVQVNLNVTVAACIMGPSNALKKTDMASYNGTLHKGSLWTKATHGGAIRSAMVAMSVTGQSSGNGNYPTVVKAYRVSSATATSTASPVATNGYVYNGSDPNPNLLIPGDNGTPAQILFNLSPMGTSVQTGDWIRFDFEIQADANRTFQVWYNTKPTGSCLNSQVAGSKGNISGVNLSTWNYLFPHAVP